MPDRELIAVAACIASLFMLIYGTASVLSDMSENAGNRRSVSHFVLQTMLPITQSIGILWPLAALLVGSAFIFEQVAATQGIQVAEADGFIRRVLFYSGLLTAVFASPVVGLLIGRATTQLILRKRNKPAGYRL
jgi:hypothetical protein